MEASGSKIGSHAGTDLHAALRLYMKSSRRHAARYPAFRNPEANDLWAALAVSLNESCAALMASALAGLEVGNPRSSRVSPVSAANNEANIFKWSTCGVMDCCMNCPKLGLSPSSSFVAIIIADTAALHWLSISTSSENPEAHF